MSKELWSFAIAAMLMLYMMLCCSDSSAKSSSKGDFCSILEDILSPRIRREPSNSSVGMNLQCHIMFYTISTNIYCYFLGDVNIILNDLAAAVGTGSKENIFRTRILNNFNANEQKWLMRIIFQDLKIGTIFLYP